MSVSLDFEHQINTRGRQAPAVVDGFVAISGGYTPPPGPLPGGFVTVAVEVAAGDFVVAGDPENPTVCDGQGLASLLWAQTRPEVDFRLWLQWPDDATSRARLRRNVWEFAETTGAIVWAPPQGARLATVAGCRDLGCAIGGEPVAWEAYQPLVHRPLRHHSDADGRLAPAGDLTLSCESEVDGSLVLKAPVLDDGRLAAICADGSLYPLGPRQMCHLLESAGWRGERIVLRVEMGAADGALLAAYLDDVTDALGQPLPISVRLITAAAPKAQLSDLLAELPSLQLRCRELARESPDQSSALLAAWYDLHRQLVEARHAGRRDWSTVDGSTLTHDRALGHARQLLLEKLDAAKHTAGAIPAPARPDAALDRRWDEHLRAVAAIALARLDPGDTDEADQMRYLASAMADLATESSLDQTRTLSERQLRLRLSIERLAAGVDDSWAEPVLETERVAPPTCEPGDAGADEELAYEELDPHAEFDAYEERFGPDPTQTVEWTRSAVFLARPRLVRAGRGTRPHGLSWLPAAVQVNEHEFAVNVSAPWPAAQAAVSGIPSDRLFLVGHVDPVPEHQVEIIVGAHGAIDVPASGVTPAAAPSDVIGTDAYVLPAAWFDRCRIVLDDGATAPLTLWCRGAAHGVDGLPDTGSAWPRAIRKTLRLFAVIPEPDPAVTFVRLYVKPPRAVAGRLAELRVSSRRVIDVRRLSASFAELTTVRTILPELRSEGTRMILPVREFEQASVVRLFHAKDDRWHPAPVERPGTFAALVAS